MKVICSYCRKKIKDKEPLDNNLISHGMCENCVEHFTRQWDGQSLGEYLDRFEVPVLIVNESCRILAANQEMADMIGRGDREIYGLLGGEVFECVYSRLEEGCGNEVHCRTCTVRNTVMHTIETGETLHRVECYVERDNGKEACLVSTVKLDKSVQVVFENARSEKDETSLPSP